jgi:flagella basal body P-ring formation protein FlgA
VRFLLYIALFILMLLPAFAYAGTVEEFVKDELSSMLPWEQGAIEIDEVEIPGLQAGKGMSLRLDMPKASRAWQGVVQGRGEGAAPPLGLGAAKVRVFKEAVVALRTMKAKTKITGEDVKAARVELIEATEAFDSVGELDGMVAKRPITAGAVIKREYVMKERVVKRGEKVLLMIEGPRIRIRSHGIAAEDGHMGATVAVRTASGKEVPGQVRGPGEIVIGF